LIKVTRPDARRPGCRVTETTRLSKKCSLTETGARHVIRFHNTLLDLYCNHGIAAFIRGTMVCGATRRSAQSKSCTGRVLSR
jgi:hypothetical protein